MHPTTPHSRQNAKPSTPTCPRAVTFMMSKLAPFAHSVYFTDSGNGLIGTNMDVNVSEMMKQI